MTIAAVRTHILDHRLDTPFESASMRFDRRQHCLVEIVCDDGTTGWGECLGPAKLNAAVVEAYGARLVGRDPLETEKLWQELYNLFRDQGQRGLAVTALSGIDDFEIPSHRIYFFLNKVREGFLQANTITGRNTVTKKDDFFLFLTVRTEPKRNNEC